MTVRTLNDMNAAGQAKPLSLGWNFSWTLAGSIVSAACQWAIFVLLAKLGTPVVVGRFSLALAITAPPFLFATLNMRTIQATDARRRYELGHCVALRLAALAVAVFYLVVMFFLSHVSFTFAVIISGVALARTFDALSDVVYGFLQQRERMDRIAFSRIIQGTLQVFALGTAYWLTHNLLFAVIAHAVASGLVTVFYDVPSAVWASGYSGTQTDAQNRITPIQISPIVPRWHFPTLLALARLSLPLGVVAVFGALSMAIPRYYIAHDLGERDLGLFSAMAYSIAAMGMIYGAMVQSAMPQLSVAYRQDRRKFARLMRRLMAAALANGLVGLMIAALCGGKLLTLFYKAEYAAHPWVLIWLAVYMTLFMLSSAMTAGLSAAHRFGVQPLVILGQAAATALGCMWLIPKFGLLGAVFGMIAGFVVCLVCFGQLLRREPAL
ncbi:MAG: hypothetical protein JO250_01395, partial [Armatimonadetes bacterium]|nr:hypothetical protein [Armatimonadota bacterium]